MEITGRVFSEGIESDDVILSKEAIKQISGKRIPLKIINHKTKELEVVGDCVVEVDGTFKYASLREESLEQLTDLLNDTGQRKFVLSIPEENKEEEARGH